MKDGFEAVFLVFLAFSMFLASIQFSRVTLVHAEVAPSTYPPPAWDWFYAYGSADAEEAQSVQPTSDGGYVVAGYTYKATQPLGYDQIMVLKIDKDGAAQWIQTYGGNKTDRAYSVQQTSDGGYIIAGCTNSFGASSFYDAYLIKTVANGTVEWSQTYNGVDGDFAYSVRQTVDGGYVVAGSTVNGTDIWLFKANATGGLVWGQTYGIADVDEAYSLGQTSDGGFILAGTVYHSTECQGILLKTGADGVEQWHKEYGEGGGDDFLWSVQETVDGGFISAGRTDTSYTDSVDSWLLKTDSSGSKQWSKTYGGVEDEYTHSVMQANDTGYMLAGYTNSYGAGDFDVYLIKTFSDGEMQWSQTYGGAKGDFAQCVCQAKDKGYVVAGCTLSSGAGSSDFYARKIAAEDSDKDGLCDSWEQRGVDYDGDGTIDLDLPGLGAGWQHKDAFVEVDYMGSDGTHDHKPNTEAMNDAKTAFRNSPVKNPDDRDGVNLHVDIDEEIPHQNIIKAFDDFDTIKGDHFGSIIQRQDANILKAKKQVYRYCLFIHQYSTNETGNWVSTTSSGLAEFPGNDFIVSLGGFTNEKGTLDEQAGTFMHELGHTLYLGHGGCDDINYKPNYLSIMNYAFQFNDLNPYRPLDYSRTKLPDLNEANLDENNGIGAEVTGQMLFTVFSNRWGNVSIFSAGFLPIDWNQNGNTTDQNVTANINNFRTLGNGSPGDEILTGCTDWDKLAFNFRNWNTFADNSHGVQPTDDLTWETVQLMREAAQSMHDVAILEVEPLEPMIAQGSDLNINVTLMNQGGDKEDTTVTIYAGVTLVASQALVLERGNITIISLACDTASFPEGNYTLRAYASPVTNETDVADNSYTYGTFIITNTGGGWVEWSRTWPKYVGSHEHAYSVCQTTDGGYVLAGNSYLNSGDFCLVKTHSDGSEQWNRTYGEDSYSEEGAGSVEQTSDGGFILAGYTRPSSGFSSLWLVKTDSEGTALWNKTYGGDYNNEHEPQWVAKQTQDGGYIAAGSRRAYPKDTYDMWIIKTDSNGNEVWNKTFGGAGWEYGYSVWQAADGGYLLGGYTDSLDPEGAAWLVRTDSLGQEKWNKTFTHARLHSLQTTTDGGCILAGAMYYYGQNDISDFWLLKADSNGNAQWNKTYDCTKWVGLAIESVEEAYCVRQTVDGGYILAGKTESYGESYAEVWIVKTDADGNKQADLMFGKNPDRLDIARSIQQTSDGAYVVAGYSQLNEFPYTHHFLLLKFRLLIVIPEFPAWMLLISLITLTLTAAVFFEKFKQT